MKAKRPHQIRPQRSGGPGPPAGTGPGGIRCGSDQGTTSSLGQPTGQSSHSGRRSRRVDHLLLLGGGSLLCETALMLKEKDLSFAIVTSERHSAENVTAGGKLQSLNAFAKANAFEFMLSEKIGRDEKVKAAITPTTAGLSFGAAWIFEKAFIDLFDSYLLNLHGARLPQDRGGGGFSWRILRGDRMGVSLAHQIDPGVDTGNIVAYERYLFPDHSRTPADFQAVAD